MSKTDFDNLISFNRKIISNKTQYLEVQQKLNSLTTKYIYTFFQVEFILQVMMDLKTPLFMNQHLICQN